MTDLRTAEGKEIDGIEKALNDDAGKATAIWITFITLELYLVMAFGSITYRDLLLETSFKLPILGTELPLLGFSEIAPGLLVTVHFYILLQLAIFDQKLTAYDSAIKAAVPFKRDRQQAYKRLSFFFRVQANYERRYGIVGISLGLIGWLTLVAVPVMILLQALLTFLPHHSFQTVWTIRGLLVFDVSLVILFWRSVAGSVPAQSKVESLTMVLLRSLNAAALLLIAVFGLGVATYPGEQFTNRLPYRDALDGLRDYLFEGEVDEVTGRPTSYLSNRIVVTDQVLVSEQQGKIAPIKSFRGRDLNKAVLTRSDLRGADFTGAMLNGAILTEAKLQDATFGCGNTGISKEGASWLDGQQDLPWPKDGCAWAQDATFRSADLQHAHFFFSHLENSKFYEANLAKADLSFVRLNGATFSGSTLTNALIHKSDARGTSFYNANLTAASFFETDFTGSIFDHALLVAALLNRTIFDGCSLVEAKLQGATLDETSFRGRILEQSKALASSLEHRIPADHRGDKFCTSRGNFDPLGGRN